MFVELLFEIYGNSSNNFNDHSLNFHVGLDYAVRPNFHVLTAVGDRLNSGPEPHDKLDYTFYLGLQWFPR